MRRKLMVMPQNGQSVCVLVRDLIILSNVKVISFWIWKDKNVDVSDGARESGRDENFL